MFKLAILDDWLDVSRGLAPFDDLEGVAPPVVFREHLAAPADVVSALEDFEIVSIMRERTPLPREVLEQLPNLRLLVTTGMHNAAVDLAAAADLGITVCGTDGVMTDTPELTWALLLSVVRDLPRQDRSVREGRWQTQLGVSLAGKRLGLIGLGRIGERMTRYARAFDMEVVAWSANLTSTRAEQVGAHRLGKDELLATSDIVSIHLRLGERSRGLIGADELAMMRPSAYLINTSRGPIVDEAALIAALREGRIAGAALDVYDHEPLPADHPFLELSNTVLAPHLGYATQDNFALYYRQTFEDIRAFVTGEPIRVIAGPSPTARRHGGGA